MHFGNDDAGLDLLNGQLSEMTLPGGFHSKIEIRSEVRAFFKRVKHLLY